MPVKIRLARHGRKRRAFYYIVAADSRAPRDGRYIERIGSYNPNTDPASIDLNFEKAVTWLQNGAVPTDTCRAILSYKGVLYKNHLSKGVKKGALSEEEAENKFNAWLKDKEQKIQAKADKIKAGEKTAKENRLKIEEEVNNTRAEELSAKQAKIVAEEAKGETEEVEGVEEEVKADTKNEEVKEEPKVEEKKEEVKEEPKAEETKEETKEEKKED
ncbi:MAG: 30S ribosomal protein S16 [Bacteroidales bacterium]|nr:30S ribosomal protein S16 [Bacteroidales bacterium]